MNFQMKTFQHIAQSIILKYEFSGVINDFRYLIEKNAFFSNDFNKWAIIVIKINSIVSLVISTCNKTIISGSNHDEDEGI